MSLVLCQFCGSEFNARADARACPMCKKNGIEVECAYCGVKFKVDYATYKSYVSKGRVFAHAECARRHRMSDAVYRNKLSEIRSEQAKRTWTKEGYKEKQSQSHKEAWTREMRDKQSRTVTERFADPKERQKQSERIANYFSDADNRIKLSDRMKEVCGSEDWRTAQSGRVKLCWDNEEYRTKQVKRLRELWAQQEVRKKQSETISALWTDAEVRNNFLAYKLTNRKLLMDEFVQQRSIEVAVPSEFSAALIANAEVWQKIVDWLVEVLGRCSRADLVDFTGCHYATICDVVNKHKLKNVVQSRSKLQADVVEFVRSIYKGEILEDKAYDFLSKGTKSQQLDIFIPEHKVAIEVNGTYWHSAQAGKDKYYHFYKSRQCRRNGVRLIHIWEYQWLNEGKQEILKSIIKHAIGLSKSIYARNLSVEFRESISMKEFFNTNNIQGFRGGEFAVCLVDSTGGIWMSFMFGKGTHKEHKDKYEMLRGASKLGYSIVGGTQKLLSFVLKEKKLTDIVYYVDYNQFIGGSLEKDKRWKLVSEQPSEKLYWVKTGRVTNRMPKKHAEIKELKRKGEVLELWDAGTGTYIYSETG